MLQRTSTQVTAGDSGDRDNGGVCVLIRGRNYAKMVHCKCLVGGSDRVPLALLRSGDFWLQVPFAWSML